MNAAPALAPACTDEAQRWTLPGGHVAWLRPLRADDVGAEQRFFNGLSLDSRQQRFHFGLRELSPALLIASGMADRSTRWPETEQLFAAAREPKALWPVPGAAHVDLHDFDAAAYEARLGPWLHAHLRKPPP